MSPFFLLLAYVNQFIKLSFSEQVSKWNDVIKKRKPMKLFNRYEIHSKLVYVPWPHYLSLRNGQKKSFLSPNLTQHGFHCWWCYVSFCFTACCRTSSSSHHQCILPWNDTCDQTCISFLGLSVGVGGSRRMKRRMLTNYDKLPPNPSI